MSNEDRQAQPDAIEPDTAQEDTDAILSRRRFLIQSGLAGAGIAVGGCDKGGKTDKAGGADPMGKPPRMHVCLDVPAPRRDAAVSRPCLSVPPRPDMQRVMKPPPKPRVCLMEPPPRRPPRKAMVCLSKTRKRRP